MLSDAGIQVVEVSRPDRARGCRKDKTDLMDAEAAARAVLAEDATASLKAIGGRHRPEAQILSRRVRFPPRRVGASTLSGMSIRVVLAEDSYIVREGVKLLLAELDDVDLVAVVEDLDGLFSAVDEHAPDVVLTDIRMPPTGTNEGIQAAERLRETHPAIGVVILSQYADAAYALSLFDNGSKGRGYLLKERVGDIDQLHEAIRAVASGGSVIDPEVVDSLVTARTTQQSSTLDRLTPRETEVLAEIAKGRNNSAIASALFVTERAVEKHINSIFDKLDLSTEGDTHRRVQAVLVFLAGAAE